MLLCVRYINCNSLDELDLVPNQSTAKGRVSFVGVCCYDLERKEWMSDIPPGNQAGEITFWLLYVCATSVFYRLWHTIVNSNVVLYWTLVWCDHWRWQRSKHTDETRAEPKSRTCRKNRRGEDCLWCSWSDEGGGQQNVELIMWLQAKRRKEKLNCQKESVPCKTVVRLSLKKEAWTQ